MILKLLIFNRYYKKYYKNKDNFNLIFHLILIKDHHLFIYLNHNLKIFQKVVLSMLKIFFLSYFIKLVLLFKKNHLDGEFKKHNKEVHNLLKLNNVKQLLKKLKRKIKMLNNKDLKPHLLKI